MKIENYKTVRLGDVCEIAAGQGAPQGESNYCDDGTPFVKAGNLIELINGKDEFEIQKVSEEVANSHKLKKYSAGSILFAKSGMSCMKGYVYQLKNDSYVVSHLAIVKPKEDSSDYIEYCLRHIKPNTLVKDEAYPSISLQDISNLQIPLPPLATQKYIAAVLDKCTALIAKHKQMLEKYDTLIKSQFVEMFGDNKYPLKSIENYIDKNILSAKKRYEVEDVIKYIDISSIDNIHNTIIGHTEYIFEKAPSRAQQCVRKNDILISTVRPNLKNVALIQKNGDFVASSGFCVLRPRCIPEYLFVNVITDSFTNEMERKTTGANYPAIKNADVYDYLIPDVPLALQEKFATFVRAVDAEKEKAQKSLDKAETLYKALMQEYFG